MKLDHIGAAGASRLAAYIRSVVRGRPDRSLAPCWRDREDVVRFARSLALLPPDGTDTPPCPACGSAHVIRNGYAYLESGTYRRFRCRDCGEQYSTVPAKAWRLKPERAEMHARALMEGLDLRGAARSTGFSGCTCHSWRRRIADAILPELDRVAALQGRRRRPLAEPVEGAESAMLRRAAAALRPGGVRDLAANPPLGARDARRLAHRIAGASPCSDPRLPGLVELLLRGGRSKDAVAGGMHWCDVGPLKAAAREGLASLGRAVPAAATAARLRAAFEGGAAPIEDGDAEKAADRIISVLAETWRPRCGWTDFRRFLRASMAGFKPAEAAARAGVHPATGRLWAKRVLSTPNAIRHD